MRRVFPVLLALLLLPAVNAATVSISQAGADPGTIMTGKYFTITLSGLSGTGAVTLVDLPSGVSVDEGTTKSFSSGTASVSWTTALASQALTNQKIYATITVAGSPSSAESSPFDIVLPPSLSATMGHGSVYGVGGVIANPAPGETHTITINVQNYGETDANDVVATISSDAGFSVSGSSSQVLGTISGGAGGSGGSASVSWTVTADSPTDGNIYVTITSSNAEAITLSIPVETEEVGVAIGGGGGGGVSRGVIIKKMEAGQMADALFDLLDTVFISKVALVSRDTVYNVKVTAEVLEKKPYPSMPDPVGKVLTYLKLTTSGVTNSQLEMAVVDFQVPVSWLKENDISQSKVFLQRDATTGWDVLETSYLSEDADYAYFRATTPGFSYFAITGEVGSGYRVPTVEAPEETEPPVTTPPPRVEVPEETPVPTRPPGVRAQATTGPTPEVTPAPAERPGAGKGIALLLLATVVVGGAAYLLKRRARGD